MKQRVEGRISHSAAHIYIRRSRVRQPYRADIHTHCARRKAYDFYTRRITHLAVRAREMSLQEA